MKGNKHHILYILLALLSLVFSTSNIAATLYQITDLGVLNINNDDAQNLRLKINANGRVVGWHRTNNSNGSFVGLTSSNSNIFQSPLDANVEYTFSDSNSQNSSVGYLLNAQNEKNATQWNANFNTATNLGTLGGNNSIALGINDTGQIVGNSQSNNSVTQPFLWRNNEMAIIPINSEAGGTADAINNNGTIAGSIFSPQQTQAYLWDGTEIRILNNINTDVAMSLSSDINSQNQIAGFMQIFTVPGSTNQRYLRSHAFLWDANNLIDLGKNVKGISWASSINDNQQIVGGRFDLKNRQAVIWEDLVALNLNTLVQDIGNWSLSDATDINPAGSIVGIGKLSGIYHAFLLTPSVTAANVSDLEITLPLTTASNKLMPRTSNNNQQVNFVVTNLGPDNATNIQIESTLHSLLSIANIQPSIGECTITDNKIDCLIDSLGVDESANVLVTLMTEQADNYQIKARVSANELDAGINENNIISRSIEFGATKPELPTTPISTISDSPATDTSDVADSNDTAEKLSTSGGCSIGTNKAFDPLFIFLLLISILSIFRPKKKRHPLN